MLRVENLSAAYGQAQVLFDVTFTVGAGEVVTLIGRNGMGKTTTIRTLMGLMRARGEPNREAAVATRFSSTVSVGNIWRPSGTSPSPACAMR